MAGAVAFAVRVTVEYVAIPAGGGGVLLGQQQSNQPGYGAAEIAGAVPIAQNLRDSIMEIVPGGATPSSANIGTALTNAANDLTTRLTQAGAGPGPGTIYSIIQGWETGGP